MALLKILVAFAIFTLMRVVEGGDVIYTLDDSPGLGRMFDGIGGLSGGGVSYD